MCVRFMQNHMELFSTAVKLFVWRLRLKSAKSTVIPLLTLSGQNVKSVNHYKYLGNVLDTELSEDKDSQRQLRYQYCAANKLRAFSRYLSAVKMYFFVPFVRPCMHHNYGVILECHARRDCLWLLILSAGLYTTCPGDRVLVAIRFNVTFLPLRPYHEQMCTCFSKDAGSPTTYGCVFWGSQIVYIRLYSLNTAIAFYSVTECSDVTVFVCLRACHATTQSYFT